MKIKKEFTITFESKEEIDKFYHLLKTMGDYVFRTSGEYDYALKVKQEFKKLFEAG